MVVYEQRYAWRHAGQSQHPCSSSSQSASTDSTRTEPQSIHHTIASSLQQVTEAWQLVYQVYVEAGLVQANTAGLHTVPQAIDPETAVIVGKPSGETPPPRRRGALPMPLLGPGEARTARQRARSTVTAHLDGDQCLALDKIYGRELDVLRRSGRKLCEFGLLADGARQAHRSARTLFDLMRGVILYALHRQCDEAVIGVHPRHAGFYCRTLGFEPAGEERTHPTVRDHAVVMLKLNLCEALNRKPMPKGLRYVFDHPFDEAVYAQRHQLTRSDLADTAVGSWLEDQDACDF
jgi:hypothetical protein